MSIPEVLSGFPAGIALCEPDDRVLVTGDFEWAYLYCPTKDLRDLGKIQLAGNNFAYKGYHDVFHVLDQTGMHTFTPQDMKQYRKTNNVFLLDLRRVTGPKEIPLPKITLLLREHGLSVNTQLHHSSNQISPDEYDFTSPWEDPRMKGQSVGVATLPDPEFLSRFEFQFAIPMSFSQFRTNDIEAQ